MTDAASPPSSKRPNDAAAATAGGDASASASASANAEPFVGTPVSASKRRYVDPRAPPTRRGRGRSTRRREVFEQFETTRALLSRWTIGEFLRTYRGDAPRLVTTLSIDDTVGDALATLARENILSAPVVDKDACLVRRDSLPSLRFASLSFRRARAPVRAAALERSLERSLMRSPEPSAVA